MAGLFDDYRESEGPLSTHQVEIPRKTFVGEYGVEHRAGQPDPMQEYQRRFRGVSIRIRVDPQAVGRGDELAIVLHRDGTEID